MRRLLNKVLKLLLPRGLINRIRRERSRKRCADVLDQWGHSRSALTGTPCDGKGEALPWYTYPALAFLTQFDFSTKRVFEWGAGESSLFWAQRVRSIVTVEHDEHWLKYLRSKVSSKNITFIHLTSAAAYCLAIASASGPFDIIIIDGLYRAQCAENIDKYLTIGGLVIIDNADWLPQTCAHLRAAGFVEIDFTGLGPVNDYPWTTSVFFHHPLQLHPIENLQPRGAMGGWSRQWDDDPVFGRAAQMDSPSER
jgi:hypothetical protein